MTDKENARAQLVAGDLSEAIQSVLAEGVDPQSVIAAIAKCAADTITQIYGAAHVAPWFAAMAVNAQATLREPKQ